MDVKNNLESLIGAKSQIEGLKSELQNTVGTVNMTNDSMQEFWNDGRYSQDAAMLTSITSAINSSVETLDEYIVELARLISVIELY